MPNLFPGATLTGANFTVAEVREAHFSGITAAQLYSTVRLPSPQFDRHWLGEASILPVGNLAGQNLHQCELQTGATLTGRKTLKRGRKCGERTLASITDSTDPAALPWRKLSSTASYLAHDLTGIRLDFNDLTGRGISPARTSRMASLEFRQTCQGRISPRRI